MKRRLVILTEIIAPYRIPVFNALAGHAGIDPHVIFLSETDRSLREWQIYKDEIRFSYEVLPAFRRRAGKYNVLLNWGLSRALPAAAPDTILCGGYSYLASWRAAVWARRRKVPFLMWVESNAGDQRRSFVAVEYLKKQILAACDGFVVPGQMSREYVASFGVAPGKIFCAPNAVDNGFFCRTAATVRNSAESHRQANNLPQHYFLFAGRLIAAKGVFDLLEAYARLSPEIRSQFALLFAGSGSDAAELRRQATSISPGRVFFPGFAQREQLAAFYGLADILVFPTHSDTWGLVVNEAMACGLPIICSKVAGCSADLVADGVNGFTISARNVGELAAAMESLARDPKLRSTMSRKSLETISRFSPAAWAEGVAEAVFAVGGSHE